MPIGLGTAALTSVGIGAFGTTLAAGFGGTLFANIVADALIGAGAGALVSAIGGRDPLTGALTGAVGGLGQGISPLLGGALGLGATGLEGIVPYALTGAATGAANAAITGGSIGKGALYGAGTGALSGGISQLMAPSAVAPRAAGGATGVTQAGATAAQIGGSPDLTTYGSGAGTISSTQLGVPGGAPVSAGPSLPTVIPAGGMETINVTASPINTSGFNGLNLTGAAPTGTRSPLSAPSQITPDKSITSEDLGTGPTQTLPSMPLTGDKGIAAGQYGSAASLSAPAPGGAEGHGIGNFLASNPALVLGALGLGYQAFKQSDQPDTIDQSKITSGLKTTADDLGAQGAALRGYLGNGQLPPGAMAHIQGATTAAKATIKSRFASMGMTGSSTEMSALAQVDQEAAGAVNKMALELMNTGIKESGLSVDLYRLLLGDARTQDKDMSDAIATFAAAIAGGGARPVARAA